MKLKTTRRAFMGTLGSALAIPSILPSGALSNSASGKLDVAYIGIGSQCHGLISAIAGSGHNSVAFCDVDLPRAEAARANFAPSARVYRDYRKLFDESDSFDAVVVATPDHWHAPIVARALQADKHVYCEKPLTRTVGEARKLRELARKSESVTQMGNQGSASHNMRRSMELIQAGLIGQVREVIVWHGNGSGRWVGDMPDLDIADPIPAGLDWDFWCGSSPLRPYKRDLYHPHRWRGWYDFGNGFLGDFACHFLNLPMRALKLGYPERIEVDGSNLGRAAAPIDAIVKYDFPARGDLVPLTVSVYDGGRRPEDGPLAEIAATFGSIPRIGSLLVGDEGMISSGLWNNDCYVKLNSDQRFFGAANHPEASQVPQSIPRAPSHHREWTDAILNGGATFSDFEIGGRLTEIGLAGCVALRAGRSMDWDGENMRAEGEIDVEEFVHPQYRREWV